MSIEDVKTSVTLESIAESMKHLVTIESLAESMKHLVTIESLAESMKHLVTEESLAASLKHLVTEESLVASLKPLATKEDLDNLGNRLESQIDDLAIAVNNEFNRVHVKLDEMDGHLVILDGRVSGLQNQLDNVYLNYTNLTEHTKIEGRVKSLEKIAFA